MSGNPNEARQDTANDAGRVKAATSERSVAQPEQTVRSDGSAPKDSVPDEVPSDRHDKQRQGLRLSSHIDPIRENKEIAATAAKDVRVLISYLARRSGKKLTELTDQLDTANADKIIAGDYGPEIEVSLWKQLAILSEAAKPASPESIRDSKYFSVVFGRRAPRRSSWRLPWIRRLALTLFGLAFLLGAYVQVTDDALTSLIRATGERDKIMRGEYAGTRVASIYGASNLKQSSENGLANASDQPSEDARGNGAPQGSPGDATSSPAGSAPPDQPINTPSAPDANPPSADPTPTESGGDVAGGAEDKVPSSLELDGDLAEAQARRDVALTAAMRGIQQEIQGAYTLLSPIFWITGSNVTQGSIPGANGEDFIIYNSMVISVQRSLNKFISDFFIPMIASFLGVAVYIIKDSAARLDSVSLSPMAEEGYWPRVILGLIAGLAVGWLTPSAQQLATITTADGGTVLATGVSSTIATLSKTALAFVVGYSIEVLFNILDAIRTALGAKDDPR